MNSTMEKMIFLKLECIEKELYMLGEILSKIAIAIDIFAEKEGIIAEFIEGKTDE